MTTPWIQVEEGDHSAGIASDHAFTNLHLLLNPDAPDHIVGVDYPVRVRDADAGDDPAAG